MNFPFHLVEKYNVPLPRYTSYPTVPHWQNEIDILQWNANFSNTFAASNNQNGISIYIHLPFCESLCTYCGCNKKITNNHAVEDEYVKAILKEWKLYLQLMNKQPVIRELHLGGGTPTFFSPGNLKKLLSAIFETAVIHPQHDFSFEGHPNNTTEEHLQTLFDLGFTRVSYGVQDHDENVQKIINRIQPFENVKRAVETARTIGYQSVNFDLIYGLPLQTPQTITKTIMQSISLQPDRVAFYSYAHVPWTSRGQRLFDENDLPNASQKMQLYMLGKKLFTEMGYNDIGMDHFALTHDDLFIASETGNLHRNFMGYTTQNTNMLIGLGVSSISDTGNAYAQNKKTLHDYYADIELNKIPVTKGYFLTDVDLRFKKYILNIICKGHTKFSIEDEHLLSQYTFPQLANLLEDNLITLNTAELTVTPAGKNFLRNICKAFDMHLLTTKNNQQKPVYSKAI